MTLLRACIASLGLALASGGAVAQAPARAYNPLLIYGGVGLGKTHLMQAIGNHVAGVNRSAKVCFLSADAFFNEYIQAIQEKRTVEFRRRYRSVDVLLIDDIHHLVSKEGTQEEFFHTFNNLHNEHKQIVLTCDRPVSELKGLEPRLAHVRLVHGDGMLGHAPLAPYDSIIAAAGGEDLPDAWLDQLAVGGRLVAPVHRGDGRGQVLVVVDRHPRGCVHDEHEAVHFVPLKSGVV